MHHPSPPKADNVDTCAPPGIAVAQILSGLRRSVEPTVMFSSLARLCAAGFSDECAVELSEGTEPMFRVTFPLPGDSVSPREPPRRPEQPADRLRTDAPTARSVITSFDAPSCDGHPSFAGTITHIWRCASAEQAAPVIARLLVDATLAALRYERLAHIAAQAERRAARLALDAIKATAIGEATGIVMTTHHLPRAEALDVLKTASRQTGRPLHDLAVEVVRAGALQPRPDPADRSSQTGHVRKDRLHVVS